MAVWEQVPGAERLPARWGEQWRCGAEVGWGVEGGGGAEVGLCPCAGGFIFALSVLLEFEVLISVMKRAR